VADGQGGPDAPRGGTNISYIPALDGIRGLAILVIMGYHGGVLFATGGFYSLDMFFTLSGFLITTLLITEWQQTSGIRLRAFWARRARRLLPALLVVVAAVALYNALLVPPGTYPGLRSDGIAALFYYANWHFIAIGSNYFVLTGPKSPLTHTWSLAVEEQFYLVWPLIVLGVLKLWRSKVALLVVCVIGALASATEMALLYSPATINRLYYGTDTRAQSLLVGAGLAVALSLWSDRRAARSMSTNVGSTNVGSTNVGSTNVGSTKVGSVAGRTRRALVLGVGLVGVAGSVLLWTTISSNDPMAYRGGFLLAALGTSAVLFSVVRSEGSILARILSIRPLRYVGRISYGAYLWHYPLFLYLDHALTGLTGWSLFAVRVAATLIVATASFSFLERPIRQGTFLRGWRAWLASPVAVSAVVVTLVAATASPSLAAGSTLTAKSTLASKTATSSPRTAAAGGTAPASAATSAATSAAGSVGSSALETRTPVKVLWLGDSTALTLGIGMSEHQASYGIESADDGILGCGVTDGAEFQLQGVDAPMAMACGTGPPSTLWPQLWAEDIAQYQPNVVMILAGRWEVVDRTYEGRWTNIEDPAYAAYVQQQLERAVAVAGSGGAHVVLLTAPCYDSGEQPDGDPWPEDSPARLAIYNRIVDEVAASSPGTSLIDFNAMACPGGNYEEYMDGIQVREADGVHFTEPGGNVFASTIWPEVVGWGTRQLALAHDHGSPERFTPEVAH
jgi:peptidoglycan/LPS O-acetylase OafA/YrhL